MSTHTNRRQALSGFMTKTTGELHLYANGTTGSDAWDGSAAAWVPGTLIGPKKTRNAALALLPDRICHNTCIHLAGVFGAAAETVGMRLFKHVDAGIFLVIDGGDDRTVVADNGGSPWAADISSTSTIGLTTAGWVVDAYMGYWVRVRSGPAAGQTRLIQSNTATTLTTNSVFSVDPGAGATFDIVRPSTEFQNTAVVGRVWGGGVTYYQNFYVTGSTTGMNLGGMGGQGLVWVSNLITASTASPAINVTGARDFNSTHNCMNTSTFTVRPATEQKCGVSQIGASALGIQMQHAANGNINNVVARTLTIKETPSIYMSYCRVLAMTMDGSRTYDRSAVISATVKLGSLDMRDSSVSMAAGADVSGSASHGITVANNSYLNMLGAVTGSGNAGAGVYAHSGAIVHIKNGAAPTLTGTVGDLSFDGSTEASEWSAIDGGTPAVSSAELSMCKEVA